MKQEIEKRADAAAKMLLLTLTQNFDDIGAILEEYEESHDDFELYHSRTYQALTVGYFALQQGMRKMNTELYKTEKI